MIEGEGKQVPLDFVREKKMKNKLWFGNALLMTIRKTWLMAREEKSLSTFLVCGYIALCGCIYSPLDKNIRPPSKMKEKILFTILNYENQIYER